MPRQPDVTDQGITAIILPAGEIIEMPMTRSFTYNPNIGALRFSFMVTKYVPLGTDKLTSRVTGVEEREGRCVVIAHRFFRHNETLYVTDADIKIMQTS